MEELIETYWNVKIFPISEIQSFVPELIETYWNVKVSTIREFRLSFFGINRNILECKGIHKVQKKAGWRELIETYWNVKTIV